MNREAQSGICERLGVRVPGPTEPASASNEDSQISVSEERITICAAMSPRLYGLGTKS
jgi:hypothetical protein